MGEWVKSLGINNEFVNDFGIVFGKGVCIIKLFFWDLFFLGRNLYVCVKLCFL